MEGNVDRVTVDNARQLAAKPKTKFGVEAGIAKIPDDQLADPGILQILSSSAKVSITIRVLAGELQEDPDSLGMPARQLLSKCNKFFQDVEEKAKLVLENITRLETRESTLEDGTAHRRAVIEIVSQARLALLNLRARLYIIVITRAPNEHEAMFQEVEQDMKKSFRDFLTELHRVQADLEMID